MVAKRTKQLGRRVRVAGRGDVNRDRELAGFRPGGRRGLAGPRATGAGAGAADADGATRKPELDAEPDVTREPETEANAISDVHDATAPADEPDTAPEAATASAGPGRVRRAVTALRPRSTRALVVIIVLSALLGGGLAYWFHSEAEALRSAAGAQNEAVIDPVRTNEVATQISGKLEKLWSYDYAQLDKQEGDVRDAATPSFLDDYKQQFQRIKELAPDQQAIVDAKVVDIAVSRLDGNRADLVAFLNQVATTGTSKDTTRAAARPRVSAERVDGQWLVSGVTPF